MKWSEVNRAYYSRNKCSITIVTNDLLHTVQDTSGQWCVERVMEGEALSSITDYQERLREARLLLTPNGDRKKQDKPMSTGKL